MITDTMNIIFLATLNKVLIDFFTRPVKQKYPDIDLWWLIYVAAATGFIIGMVSGENAFPGLFLNDLGGRVLTAVLIGGGSNVIHDLVGGKQEPVDPAEK